MARANLDVRGGDSVARFAPATTIGLVGHSVPTFAEGSAAVSSPFLPVMISLWLAVGFVWSGYTIGRSVLKRRRWRAVASCGKSLAAHANPTFSTQLNRVQIRRLPNTSLVFSTGVLHPEIWIGDRVRTESQVEAALNHELCHIAANDSLTLFLIVVLERLLWWNPLIWLLGRHARRQMEYACDSRCQGLIGRTKYRQSLAELFLAIQQQNAALEIPLGNASDIVTRMEKIGMTHSFQSRHALALIVGGALVAAASSNLAAHDDAERPTLIQCHELLPEGVQYDFKIASDIDTREGQQGELTVTLVDASKPGSHELPEGSGEFL